MTGVLVDANVILDVLTDDPKWESWSEASLERCARTATLYINSIVYSEISIGFDRIEDMEAAMMTGGFRMLQMPKEALFLAGKAFLKYRKNKSVKRSPLPDFYIGAQAAVLAMPLLTRDVARYHTYFPSVRLIHP